MDYLSFNIIQKVFIVGNKIYNALDVSSKLKFLGTFKI